LKKTEKLEKETFVEDSGRYPSGRLVNNEECREKDE
jgi:hypothetical protein